VKRGAISKIVDLLKLDIEEKKKEKRRIVLDVIG
jgi:hypothetical protein